MVKDMRGKETGKDNCLINQEVISKISLFFTVVPTGLVSFACRLTAAEKVFVDA